MAIWVVLFPREGYKIKYILAMKSTYLPKGNYLSKRLLNNIYHFNNNLFCYYHSGHLNII
jgi:hypothetical protein